MAASAGTDPTVLLERAFTLYDDYLAITETSVFARMAPEEPEFYAPPPAPIGLTVH